MSASRFISLYKELLSVESSVEKGKVNASNFAKFARIERIGKAIDKLGLSQEERTKLVNSLRSK